MIAFITYFLIQFNWIDWVIILVSMFYVIEGYAVGAISGLFDIASFLLSFAAGLKMYKFFGDFIHNTTHLPLGFSHISAFVFAAVVTEMVLRLAQGKLTDQIRKFSWLNDSIAAKINRFLGIIPGFFSGLILLAFFLTVLIVLPVSTSIKQAINASKLGSVLVGQTQTYERNLAGIFGGRPDDLLTFFTVEPDTNGTIILDFKVADGIIDQDAEQQMLYLVNAERAKQNLPQLVMDNQLRILARSHSQDMLARGYFSHYTPEGKSPFDRMNAAGITYNYAGENLAFAQNVNLAMQGLMQSPGHRANILSPNFKKIGIGVINAGVYGEMFSQEFTD